jgi:signal transduction histidine kinase
LMPKKEDEPVRISISNDGHIIPADMREKIFEPFVRLKESVKQKGTGIGLALARSLAELHGGNIYMNNEDAEMNVFILSLPFRGNTAKRDVEDAVETINIT